MKAKEFDQAFDEGLDSIDEHIDWSSAQRPGLETRRINIDFPEWMIAALDREASRLGIARQAVVKTWLAERLDQGKRG
ncbi:type II toxin-antitoxin system BrnA family antitoxin [Endozoicomonas ascidiicola]|uniref:type II toxin-antitoxin system BrnA family antitoxin n=1 Tax=Endozoicomonas ascidiicola TaxID=1698521 RepID=UPI00082B8FD7|nr:CopG family transcriptional regulator [Endozoicomonas ascidiicola]